MRSNPKVRCPIPAVPPRQAGRRVALPVQEKWWWAVILGLFASLGAFGLPECAANQGNDGGPVIRIKGSESMLRIVKSWTGTFHDRELSQSRARAAAVEQQTNQPVTPQPVVSFDTSGTGSSHGIAAIVNGHAEIAASSRAIKTKEMQLAYKHSASPPQEILVGFDVIALVVNSANPLVKLDLSQVAAIYRQQEGMQRWTDLGISVPGCDSQLIQPYGRRLSSGSHALLREVLLGDTDRFRQDLSLASNEAMLKQLATRPCGIGYVSMAHVVPEVKALCLTRHPAQPCRHPAEAGTSRSPIYPLIRPLYFYVGQAPQGILKAFIDFVLGLEGQKLLDENGYLSRAAGLALQSGP